jgi:hypothetical protein
VKRFLLILCSPAPEHYILRFITDGAWGGFFGMVRPTHTPQDAFAVSQVQEVSIRPLSSICLVKSKSSGNTLAIIQFLRFIRGLYFSAFIRVIRKFAKTHGMAEFCQNPG